MNVIFEGISGVGKTTLINKLKSMLDPDDTIVIEDLEYDTPIKTVLQDMVQESPLMQNHEKFKTSIYESLLLAANHHYIQEKLRLTNKICLYDRDFLTLLVYQKYLIQEEYPNWEEIFDVYKKIVLLNLKSIDLLIYIDMPLNVAVTNTEKRDGRKFSENDIRMLKLFRQDYEQILMDLKNEMLILKLNGLNDVERNSNEIYNAISRVRRK